jgi:hypothetical protein
MGEVEGTSTIPVLNRRWRWVVNFTLLPLYPRGKSHQYALYRGRIGSHIRSELYVEDNILLLSGIEPRFLGSKPHSYFKFVYMKAPFRRAKLTIWKRADSAAYELYCSEEHVQISSHNHELFIAWLCSLLNIYLLRETRASQTRDVEKPRSYELKSWTCI